MRKPDFKGVLGLATGAMLFPALFEGPYDGWSIRRQRSPSGKDRSKVKAARKANQKRRR